MWESDIFRVGMVINIFWLIVSLYLNHRWYKYAEKLNDEWAEICEKKVDAVIEYFRTEEEHNNEQSTR